MWFSIYQTFYEPSLCSTAETFFYAHLKFFYIQVKLFLYFCFLITDWTVLAFLKWCVRWNVNKLFLFQDFLKFATPSGFPATRGPSAPSPWRRRRRGTCSVVSSVEGQGFDPGRGHRWDQDQRLRSGHLGWQIIFVNVWLSCSTANSSLNI